MNSLKFFEEIMAPISLIGFILLSIIYYSSLTLAPFFRRNPFEAKYYENLEKKMSTSLQTPKGKKSK